MEKSIPPNSLDVMRSYSQQLIRRRLASTEAPNLKPRKLPKVNYPPSINLLLSSPNLWIDVDGEQYIPKALVTSLLVRKDGEGKTKDAFSVFLAMQKDYIMKHWNIVAKSTSNKQKNQFWDRLYVEALFTNILLHEKANRRNINKIAYEIVQDIDVEELNRRYKESLERALSS
jgi:hypothetical protein